MVFEDAKVEKSIHCKKLLRLIYFLNKWLKNIGYIRFNNELTREFICKLYFCYDIERPTRLL